MDFCGDYDIPAPPQAVWDALVDPQVLRACITGCRELEQLSDTAFAAVVAAKVGPVNATFKGSVELLDLEPPRSYTIAGQGQGGAAGFARMKARVALAENAGATRLHYEANAEVGGKLAAVGSRLVQAVAKKNADEFFAAFAARLGGAAAAAAASTAPEGTEQTEAATQAAEAQVPQAAIVHRAQVAARPATAVTTKAVAAGLPVWVVALIAGGCGVVLGFALGRW